MELTHIDLFSGIGGFALAARWAGFKTIAFVEIESYAQEIIKQNFGAVSLSDAERCNGRQDDEREIETERARIEESGFMADTAKSRCQDTREYNGGSSLLFTRFSQCRPRIYGDIRTFDGSAYRGATLLTGGFPCQPFSQAGKRRGKEDDRYLWPEMLRVISQARPAWVLGENVAGIVTMELDRVLSDLESEGYAVQPLVIPACAVDAKHRRDRVWILGYAESGGGWRQSGTWGFERPSETLADSIKQQWDRRSNGACRWPREPLEALQDARRNGGKEDGESIPESELGRVAHGISNRVDRLKGLGNAIVPQVAYEILRVIAQIAQWKGAA